MAETEAGLYNDNPTVGSDSGEWQRYQQQQGRGPQQPHIPVNQAPQVEVSVPLYSQGQSVHILRGVHQGLPGIIHNVGRTQDGQYSYVLGDIPHPANPNKSYNYMEDNLEQVSPQTPDPTQGIATNHRLSNQPVHGTNNGSGLQQAVSAVSDNAHIMEMIVNQLSALDRRMNSIEQSINTNLGRVNIHVTYDREPGHEQPTEYPDPRRSDEPVTPDDELDSSGEPGTETEAQLDFIREPEPETEGEPVGDPD